MPLAPERSCSATSRSWRCSDDGMVAGRRPRDDPCRFNHLTADDAPAVVDAARAHAASVTGHLADWPVPSSIVGRISVVTAKHGGI